MFVGANLDVRGIVWARRGGALNLAAIVLNLGVMPARPEAWRASGLAMPAPHVFLNSRPTDSVLVWIGDCIPMPSWLPGAAPFSVGDALIAIAIAAVLRHACGSSGQFAPALRRRARPEESWWWHLGDTSVLEQSKVDHRRLTDRNRGS